MSPYVSWSAIYARGIGYKTFRISQDQSAWAFYKGRFGCHCAMGTIHACCPQCQRLPIFIGRNRQGASYAGGAGRWCSRPGEGGRRLYPYTHPSIRWFLGILFGRESLPARPTRGYDTPKPKPSHFQDARSQKTYGFYPQRTLASSPVSPWLERLC